MCSLGGGDLGFVRPRARASGAAGSGTSPAQNRALPAPASGSKRAPCGSRPGSPVPLSAVLEAPRLSWRKAGSREEDPLDFELKRRQRQAKGSSEQALKSPIILDLHRPFLLAAVQLQFVGWARSSPACLHEWCGRVGPWSSDR